MLAVNGNIGNVYQSLGNYARAIDFHQKALNIAISINNPVERAIQYVNLGNDYNSSKNYRDAIEHIEKALPVFTDTKTQSYLLSAYEAMITANNGLRNYGHSVRFYEKYVQLKDSLNKNELNSALDSLKVKFHTEQTEQENEALMLQTSLHQKTIRLQQVAILSSLIAVVLLLSLILLVLSSRRNMKRINSRLQELSAFKDSLTHFLVHDLKNALNTIVNFDPGSDTEYQISIVKHSGKRMLNLVHNLLDIGKFENDHMEMVPVVKSLWQIADNAGQHLSFQAVSRQITIQQHRDADYIVKADEGITERILINLLENAIKHSPDDGVVEVLAESAMNMVRITIKDHGEGIPAGFMPTVFEKYTTSKNKLEPGQRSYGLGLAFCKLAVEAQGGEISIQSEPGHGTSVWFTLPLVKVTSDMTIPPASAEPLLQDDMLIHLDAEEIAVLKQPGVELRELSIHQISDIKDILKQLDTTLYPGISQWKQAVERALYDCDSNRYTKLIQLIRPSDV
jgi:signal transduction histidine kinase